MIKFNLAPGFVTNGLYENAYAKAVMLYPVQDSKFVVVVGGYRNKQDALDNNGWFQKEYTVPTPIIDSEIPRDPEIFMSMIYAELMKQPLFIDAIYETND